MKNTIEVFINEEYGYRAWKWLPGMTEQEFIGWYNDLTDSDIIKYYFNIKSLPGKIVPWPNENSLKNGNASQRFYGDPKSFRPYYYMHMHDVNDTLIAVGDDVFRRKTNMKYDWKTHWIDWTIKMERDRPVV